MTETPYTFQKSFPKEALQQSTWWYDRTGKRYLVSEMNRMHKLNAASKLIDMFGAKRALASNLMKGLVA